MNRHILVVAGLLFVALWSGCGGGTRGSGGNQIYDGLVITSNGAPLPQVSVTILETGDTTQTDANGGFSITTDPVSGTVNFLVEGTGFSGTAESKDIPANALRIFVQLTVGSGASPKIESKTQVQETRPDPARTPTPRSGGQITTVTPTPQPTGTSGGGDSTTPTATPTGDSGHNGGDDHGGSGGGDGGSGSSTHTPSPTPTATSTQSQNGQVVDASGNISSLSSNLVVVNGNQFVPTSQTEYKGLNGAHATFADFKVGDKVKARGRFAGSILNLERLEKQ